MKTNLTSQRGFLAGLLAGLMVLAMGLNLQAASKKIYKKPQFEGVILDVNPGAKTFNLKTPNQKIMIYTEATATFIKNGRPVKLSEILAGDHAYVYAGKVADKPFAYRVIAGQEKDIIKYLEKHGR